jgi:hypothetical protein
MRTTAAAISATLLLRADAHAIEIPSPGKGR